MNRSPAHLYRAAMRAAALGLAVNLALGAAKLAAGIIADSFALLSDAVDMHIEVDAGATVDEGHRIGHVVKDRLVNQFATLRDVLVHLEPYPHQDK